MLIRFSVENFRSFLEPQVLSMAAAKGLRRRHDENTFSPELDEKGVPNLLRTAAIYGPNASGKSNLVKALKVVEQLVLGSAKFGPDDSIDVQPFRLDPIARSRDSKFEIDFIEGGVRYQFGFSANDRRITSEWLTAYPRARPQVYYERYFNSDLQKDDYTFGKSLEGGRLRHDWANQTAQNTLFLSRAVQLSAEQFQQLRKPYQWFAHRLRIVGSREHRDGMRQTLKQCEGVGKAEILEFLNSIDVPIADITVDSQPFDFEALTKALRPALVKQVRAQLEKRETSGDTDMKEARFFHRSSDGKELVEFKETDESDGTRALFAFAGPWSSVLRDDHVLIVDELDSSLHPIIVHRLIEMLSAKGKKAQLVFTTHDTSVMDTRLLRRDQYWFTERDSRGVSKLYSLHDFKGREDDSIHNRYFRGAYGATPILRGLWRHGD